MNKASISIIIPCYNCSDTISDTLNSVVSCSNPTIEIVLVDDGSKDKTKNIIDTFSDRRINYYYKENGGYSSAVNYGVQKANGLYILFLGSDDLLINGILDTLIGEIENKHPDIACFSALIEDTDKNEKYDDPDTFISSYFFFKGSVKGLEALDERLVKILYRRDTCKCFKRSTIGSEVHYGKYGICSDEMFSMSVAFNSSSFSFIPLQGYSITKHSDSVSHDLKSNKKLRDIFYCFSLFEVYLKSTDFAIITNTAKAYWTKYEKYLNIYSLRLFCMGYYHYRKRFFSFLTFATGKKPSLKYKLISFFPKFYYLYVKIKQWYTTRL